LIFASSNILKEEGIQSEEEDGMQFKSLTQNRQIGIFLLLVVVDDQRLHPELCCGDGLMGLFLGGLEREDEEEEEEFGAMNG
jgi:hypothetical protein